MARAKLSRRTLLGLVSALPAGRAIAQPARRIVVAFGNITEDPAVRLEGTGFNGLDVRESIELAARAKPIDLMLYDNGRERARAMANVADAVRRHVDVYIHYGWDTAVSAEIARRLAEAEIPLLVIGRPVANVPSYGADNTAAGRLAGDTLVRHGRAAWEAGKIDAVIIGPPSDALNHLEERAAAIGSVLAPVAVPVRIDTGGDSLKAGGQFRSFLDAHVGRKILVAALDDATALAVKAATESVARLADVVIVSHGCDRSLHGNASDKKELDPTRRGSILLGSVAFYLDRYGYDVLPIATELAARKPVAPRTTTRHRLVTPTNVFMVYPPIDIN